MGSYTNSTAGQMAPLQVLAVGGGITAPAVFSYSSGQLTSVVGTGWSTYYTYNVDGSLATVNENGVTRSFVYNGNGSLASIV